MVYKKARSLKKKKGKTEPNSGNLFISVSFLSWMFCLIK